jgi:hypothetical protein
VDVLPPWTAVGKNVMQHIGTYVSHGTFDRWIDAQNGPIHTKEAVRTYVNEIRLTEPARLNKPMVDKLLSARAAMLSLEVISYSIHKSHSLRMTAREVIAHSARCGFCRRLANETELHVYYIQNVVTDTNTKPTLRAKKITDVVKWFNSSQDIEASQMCPRYALDILSRDPMCSSCVREYITPILRQIQDSRDSNHPLKFHFLYDEPINIDDSPEQLSTSTDNGDKSYMDDDDDEIF